MDNYKKALKKSKLKYNILIIVFIVLSFSFMLSANLVQFLNINFNPLLLVFASVVALLIVVVLVISKNNFEHFFNAQYLTKVEKRVEKLEKRMDRLEKRT